MGPVGILSDLYPLLTNFSDLAKEYRLRRKEYETIAVHPLHEATYIEEGWIHDKKLKTKVRLKRRIKQDEHLENKFWCLLYKMGYLEMNQGRNFRIRYKRKGVEDGEKQIDVFAKDNESIIIAECKSSEELKTRGLQKDIEAFVGIKGDLAKSINRYYGIRYKPKILWLFVTENIVWSKPDKDRAIAGNIRIITEHEFKYFKRVIDHLGHAARYQFLAEYFQGQPIPELKNKIVPAIRGKLVGKSFYCFVTTPKQLLKIAFINHRALLDPQGYPTYQRLADQSRLRQIGNFINKGGFFPTNLLINFKQNVRFDISHKDDVNDIHFGYLYLPDKYKSAWIIDGQHRLYAYSGLKDKFMNQNIVVLAFEKLPQEEEANLFVTINHEQRSVPRNLLDDLEGDLKWGSSNPNERIGAIAARLTHILNFDLGGPFYNRVTAQGIETNDITCLTVPEIKNGIRRAGLVGKAILQKKIYEPGPLCEAIDEETLNRAQQALNYYFSLIRETNSERWAKGRTGYLCTNPGVRGYLMLLAALIDYEASITKLDAKEISVKELIKGVEKYLAPVFSFISIANDFDFEEQFKVPFGSGGPRQYYYRLCRFVRQSYPNFCPEGYEDWEISQSEEQRDLADKRVKRIEISIRGYIFDKFKELYGDDYYEIGISNKEMKKKAYDRSLDDDREKRLPFEAYLELIDLKKIVENRDNWRYFKGVFNIPMLGKKGEAKNLVWMDRLNELRRISAHPSPHRNYCADDFKFLERLEQEFISRLEKAKTMEDSIEGYGEDILSTETTP